MTISEQLFEQYCNEQGIDYQRIEEGLSKTPDYFVNVDSLDIVIEVKQVDQRKEDDAVLKEYQEKKALYGFQTDRRGRRSVAL